MPAFECKIPAFCWCHCDFSGPTFYAEASSCCYAELSKMLRWQPGSHLPTIELSNCKSKNRNQQTVCISGLIPTPKLGQNRRVETWAASLLRVFLCHIALSDFKSQSWPVLMGRKCLWPVVQLMGMEEEEIRRNVFFNYCMLRERGWTPNLSWIQSDRQMNKSVLISVLHQKSRELFSPNDVFETANQPHYTSDSFSLCSWVVLPPYNFSPMNRKL